MSIHNLIWQGKCILHDQYRAGYGHAKIRGDAEIHSTKTYHNYEQNWKHFCSWLKNTHPDTKTIDQAAKFLHDWTDDLQSQGKSAWTVRAYASAACKVTGVKQADLQLPVRHAADITRSRGTAVRDAHYSAANNHDMEIVAHSYGPRRSELVNLRGNDLCKDASSPIGLGVKVINSKGGRSRIAPLCGPYAAEAANIIRQANNHRVFSHIPSCMDVHNIRAEYAAERYHEFARPISELSHDERYYSRNGVTGIIYDRSALSEVSRALGHGHTDRSGTYHENPAEVVRHYAYRF